jgi:thioredoxin 1
MNLTQWNAKIKKYDKPVVVEFWAGWCGPCKFMAPSLNQVKIEFTGKVELLKVNADEESELMRELKIYSIPTILVYNQGNLLSRKTGAMSIDQLRHLFQIAENGMPGSVGLSTPARVFRLIVGVTLAVVGYFTHNSIPLFILGGIVLFSAVYDRCPIWKFITERLEQKNS